MMNNPYQKYKEQSVTTMTPIQILLALYDKAILELNKALIFIDKKDIPKAHNSIIRVYDIITALDVYLNDKYEVGKSLEALYRVMREQLTRANVKKDPEIIKTLITYFQELRDSFALISKKGYVYEQAASIAD